MSPLVLGKWNGKVGLRKRKHYIPNSDLTLPLPNGKMVYLDETLEEDLPECMKIELRKTKGLGSKETPISIIELAMHTCLRRDPMALQKLGELWTEGAQRKVKDDDETEVKGTEKKRTISLIETAMKVDLRQDPMGLQKLGQFIDGEETAIKDAQEGTKKISIIETAMAVDLKTDPMALQKLGRSIEKDEDD